VQSFFVDSHTHIDQFDTNEIPSIVDRAKRYGVGLILAAGTTVESSKRCVSLADEYPIVEACVGVHPMDLREPLNAEMYGELRELALHSGVVAISEIGLDYMDGRPDKVWQEEAFRLQIRIALEVEKPIIFHNRDAALEPLRILQEEGAENVGVIAHYFQGSTSYAEACLDQGIVLSFAKPILRDQGLQEIARQCPLDQFVLETDSFPQPYKKNREAWTEPHHIIQVAECLAQVKEVSMDEIKKATFKNIQRVLR
jgi:TatD DNase family protein